MTYNVGFIKAKNNKAINNKATIENFFKNFEMMYGATGCNKNPYLTKIKMSGKTLFTAPCYVQESFRKFKADGIVQHFSVKYDKINEKKGILSIGYIIENCNMEMRHYIVKTKVRKEDAYVG